MDSRLIQKVHMDCPVCGKIHDVEEWERISETMIKDDTISYPERYYFCTDADEEEREFETAALLNANLLTARNVYRRKHGLLTSDEIVALRRSYGLSQVELSRLMGWGEATVSRYESKAIQDESYDAMLRMIRDNPWTAIELLDRNKDRFPEARRMEIRCCMKEKLESYGKEYLSRETLESNYVDFLEPSLANGYTALNIDRLEECISYIAESVPNLFKVKLMKILWYTDALSMKLYGHAVTGLVYQHEAMGALPLGHYSLVNLERLNVHEEPNVNYDTVMLHFYPIRNMSYSHLTKENQSILDKVISKFKMCRAQEIVDYMHAETAYTETKPGEIISFELAAGIRDF